MNNQMDNQEIDRVDLVHALDILHKIRDSLKCLEMRECVDAFNVVFEWIDNMVILLNKTGGRYDEK